MITYKRIPDNELSALCDNNGCPSVRENLAQGQTQEQATAYLVGEAPLYDDGESRWLQGYIEWLHTYAMPPEDEIPF